MSIANHHQATTSTAPVPVPSPIAPIQRLESGDHLSRAEFERHYKAMPEVKKAELNERIVYMPSPVRMGHHGEPHSDLVAWTGYYRSKTPHLRMGDIATVRLDEDNEPQPDVLLLLPSWAGGSYG